MRGEGGGKTQTLLPPPTFWWSCHVSTLAENPLHGRNARVRKWAGVYAFKWHKWQSECEAHLLQHWSFSTSNSVSYDKCFLALGVLLILLCMRWVEMHRGLFKETIRNIPEGKNSTHETLWSWPVRVLEHSNLPLSCSHSLTVRSAELEAEQGKSRYTGGQQKLHKLSWQVGRRQKCNGCTHQDVCRYCWTLSAEPHSYVLEEFAPIHQYRNPKPNSPIRTVQIKKCRVAHTVEKNIIPLSCNLPSKMPLAKIADGKQRSISHKMSIV